MLCPSTSNDEQKNYGVMLIYKENAVGAYMLQKPSGEVTALTGAATTAAPLTEQEVQSDFASQQTDAAADAAQSTEVANTEQAVDTAAQTEEQANADAPVEQNDAAMPTE